MAGRIPGGVRSTTSMKRITFTIHTNDSDEELAADANIVQQLLVRHADYVYLNSRSLRLAANEQHEELGLWDVD